MESLNEKLQDRKPYESPAVVYETALQVSAGTTDPTVGNPPNDLFGLIGNE
jgi:hypothetical protein